MKKQNFIIVYEVDKGNQKTQEVAQYIKKTQEEALEAFKKDFAAYQAAYGKITVIQVVSSPVVYDWKKSVEDMGEPLVLEPFDMDKIASDAAEKVMKGANKIGDVIKNVDGRETSDQGVADKYAASHDVGKAKNSNW